MARCPKCGQICDPDTGDCLCRHIDLGRMAKPQEAPVKASPLFSSTPLPTRQGEKRDYFISFYSPHVEHARRVYEILREMNRSAWVFDVPDGSGNYLSDVNEALKQSRRIVCITSPGFFHSQCCLDELNWFWSKPNRDPDRLVTFLEVKACDAEPLYTGVRVNRLTMEPSEPAYRETVRRAVQHAERTLADDTPLTPVPVRTAPRPVQAKKREFVVYGPPEVLPDEPRKEPAVNGSVPWWKTPAFRTVAAAAAVLFAVYGHYWLFGPSGPTDYREVAAHWVSGRDIALPAQWVLASTKLREYVAAAEVDPRDYWDAANGEDPLPFERDKEFLRPVGSAVLKSTESVEDGIAQYRMVVERQPIRLLADVQRGGDAYHGFLLRRDGPGRFKVWGINKVPKQAEQEVALSDAVVFKNGQTLHDLGIIRREGQLTLTHDGKTAANWDVGLGPLGTFGLKGETEGKAAALYRWSVAAKSFRLPTVLAALLRMPGPPRRW